MGVGSLHAPREYDGRLPPDVDYYLDLVIPRKKEPRTKIGSRVDETLLRLEVSQESPKNR